ncbi:MAG: glycosyltransferase family 4 protein [Caldilineales bacterium]|nr:glycosyltransferase family 4 protein [Caldilineales bacterium]
MSTPRTIPMRLLAIAPTAFYRDYGCHIRIRGQLQALQAAGHDICLATYPAGRDIEGLRSVRPPIPFVRTMPVGSSRRKILLDAALAPTALIAALRFRPQIIHAYLHEGALIGQFLSRLFRVPLTFDYQGSLTSEMLDHHFISAQSRFRRPLSKLERWIDRQPSAIFPSSQRAAELLRRQRIPGHLIHPVPDSIDPDIFSPRRRNAALARRLGIDPARPVVVYLGLLAPYQGTDLLLEAIAHPALASHPAQFLIMGFPGVEGYRRRAHDMGLSERVRFTGGIAYSRAPDYLALGDLAVAPKLSSTEGSGKLLPYMSMALPVVASDSPVHREYLGDHAVYMAKPTPAGLANAIRTTLDNLTHWQDQARILRQRVQERYTWQDATAVMGEVFHTLVTRDG